MKIYAQSPQGTQSTGHMSASCDSCLIHPHKACGPECPWVSMTLGVGVTEPATGEKLGAISSILTSSAFLQSDCSHPFSALRLAASPCLTFYSFHMNFDVCFNGISPRAGAGCESCISYLSACQSISPYSDGYPLCIPLSPRLDISYALVPKGTPSLWHPMCLSPASTLKWWI